jgi:uncharacterized membrane protein YfhO
MGAIEHGPKKPFRHAYQLGRRITLFFFGISLFLLDNHSVQGYISALVEKYYVLFSSFFGGGSLAQSGWVELKSSQKSGVFALSAAAAALAPVD